MPDRKGNIESENKWEKIEKSKKFKKRKERGKGEMGHRVALFHRIY